MSGTNAPNPDDVLKKAQQLWAKNKIDEAHQICATCLRANPNHGPLLHFFAGILEKKGNIFGALKHLEFACKSPAPQNQYFLDLAALMIRQNMFMESQNVLNVAMKRDPGDSEIQSQLAHVLILNGFFDQGVKLFNHVLSETPGDWQRWDLYARTIAKSSRPAQAGALFDQALEVAHAAANKPTTSITPPQNSDLARLEMNRAEHLKTIGDIEGCKTAVRTAIGHSRYHARAWTELASLKAFGDEDFTMVETMIRSDQTKLSNSDLQHLYYALGLAHMTRGDGKLAMGYYVKANRLQRDQINYDEGLTLGYLKHLPEYFTPEIIAQHALTENGDEQQFIFIVGMPRSGSTLLEQILDQHSDAFGVGEIRTMPNLVKRIYGELFPSQPIHEKFLTDPKRLEFLAKAYRAEVLRTLPPEAIRNGKGPRYIVDKMLGNFVSAGLIAMAFPNSKIIHSRRDPIDTAFSCFTHFFGDGHKHLCDLREIGRFYLSYRDLMAYWETILTPEQLITVDYEKVIDDLEGEARRLIEFLGLGWQEACLEFYATKREVRTHSALEVRKPVYRSSMERWRPYQDDLVPLFEELGVQPD
ncbi:MULTISPECIES: tetratricopeptide repeat-containing sulfotransferase family protein [Thalassospira]|uniref:Sulfotransferase n=2 Tax=Thalassospira TaxID=168934 RepID=A0A367W1H5_9PROT|nr:MULTISPECIES: tetratricopeptide repeat-containing sulfotransferase family protein [Thalassospira]MDG4721731.1 sulfotransferase [Thalassospira sp. FZY0004]RCK31719.1 hypothetical protein TH19_20800 [Thalassospira profundimaris]